MCQRFCLISRGGSGKSLAENRCLLVASPHTVDVICNIKDVSGTILWRKESERSKNESDGSGFWNKRTEKMRDLWPNLMKKQRYGTAAGNVRLPFKKVLWCRKSIYMPEQQKVGIDRLVFIIRTCLLNFDVVELLCRLMLEQ